MMKTKDTKIRTVTSNRLRFKQLQAILCFKRRNLSGGEFGLKLRSTIGLKVSISFADLKLKPSPCSKSANLTEMTWRSESKTLKKVEENIHVCLRPAAALSREFR